MQATGLKGCEADGSWLLRSGPCGVVQIDGQDLGHWLAGRQCFMTSSAQCQTTSRCYSTVQSPSLVFVTAVYGICSTAYDPACPAKCTQAPSGKDRSRQLLRASTELDCMRRWSPACPQTKMSRQQHFVSPANHIHGARTYNQIQNGRRASRHSTIYRHTQNPLTMIVSTEENPCSITRTNIQKRKPSIAQRIRRATIE